MVADPKQLPAIGTIVFCCLLLFFPQRIRYKLRYCHLGTASTIVLPKISHLLAAYGVSLSLQLPDPATRGLRDIVRQRAIESPVLVDGLWREHDSTVARHPHEAMAGYTKILLKENVTGQ